MKIRIRTLVLRGLFKDVVMDEHCAEFQMLVEAVSKKAMAMQYPAGHDICLLIASSLIETAGHLLASHETGNRVSELMLLSARVESLMKSLPAG